MSRIPNINPKRTSEKLIAFIQGVARKEKCKDVLIGVSGGIDSATSLTLSVRALGKKHVFPVRLPYGKLSTQSTKDAMIVINSLKIPLNQVTTVDIKPFTDSLIKYDSSMDEGRRGNIMARMRMVVLYDLSKKLNRLVVGTENKTEHLLGYYTRFGDEASDIEPIKDLYKTQVYQLAKFLGVPEKILTKAPTAGLWKGQTDEGEFGFQYKTADEILYLYSEKGLSQAEIIAKGYKKKVVKRLWWWLEKGRLKDTLPYAL